MRSRAGLALALAVACVAAGWWFLAPTSLGGRATYVVTHGVSMEPGFHTGDLAIVYPASGYQVGQVVAYRSRLLHTIVLHRIIARDGDRFVFKGDHNTWRDPEHPTQAQLVGRLVVHLPHGGTLLGWAHTPYLTAPLAFALAVAGAASTRTHRRRRRQARAEKTPVSLHLPRPRWTSATAATATAALAGAALTAVSYTLPTHTTTAHQVPYTEQVSYGYTAATAPNLVYPDGRVHSGQTVFLRLIHQLQVNATWTLHTPARHHTSGTATLQAVMATSTGWTHTLTLSGPTPLNGDRVHLSGSLALPTLNRLAQRAAQLTGIPTDGYTLTLQPRLHIHATLAGQPLALPSTPAPSPLTLQATTDTITPVGGAPATDTVPAPGSADIAQPGLPPVTATHTVTVNRPAPAAWPLFAHTIPLGPIRWAAASATALLVAVLLLLAWAGRRPRDDSDRLRRALARHRGSIVAVRALAGTETTTIVDVTSIDALARIARRYDRLILEQRTQPGTYLVDDDTTLYRYQHHGPDHPSSGRRHAAPTTRATA